MIPWVSGWSTFADFVFREVSPTSQVNLLVPSCLNCSWSSNWCQVGATAFSPRKFRHQNCVKFRCRSMKTIWNTTNCFSWRNSSGHFQHFKHIVYIYIYWYMMMENIGKQKYMETGTQISGKQKQGTWGGTPLRSLRQAPWSPWSSSDLFFCSQMGANLFA